VPHASKFGTLTLVSKRRADFNLAFPGCQGANRARAHTWHPIWPSDLLILTLSGQPRSSAAKCGHWPANLKFEIRKRSFKLGASDLSISSLSVATSKETRSEHAENWRWSSLWHRNHAESEMVLADWPLARPRNWTQLVNEAQTELEVKVLRQAVVRGTPFGEEGWVVRTAQRLGLESTLHPRGRPKKKRAEKKS
jgi:hypothetical protein